jgi:hypothetical protein
MNLSTRSPDYYGGAVRLNLSYANVTDSKFEECFSLDDNGEGAAIWSDSDDIYVERCCGYDCTAAAYGHFIQITRATPRGSRSVTFSTLFRCGVPFERTSGLGSISSDTEFRAASVNVTACVATKGAAIRVWMGKPPWSGTLKGADFLVIGSCRSEACISLESGATSLKISNSIFVQNTGTKLGESTLAVSARQIEVTLESCKFFHSGGTRLSGGFTIVNCWFSTESVLVDGSSTTPASNLWGATLTDLDVDDPNVTAECPSRPLTSFFVPSVPLLASAFSIESNALVDSGLPNDVSVEFHAGSFPPPASAPWRPTRAVRQSAAAESSRFPVTAAGPVSAAFSAAPADHPGANAGGESEKSRVPLAAIFGAIAGLLVVIAAVFLVYRARTRQGPEKEKPNDPSDQGQKAWLESERSKRVMSFLNPDIDWEGEREAEILSSGSEDDAENNPD